MLRPLAPFTAVASVGGATAAVDPEAIRARFTRIESVAQLDAALASTTRPVMLDFYADWCVSCLEMEKFTFSDEGVARRMSDVWLLETDVTHMTESDRALLQRFDLFGPTVHLFIRRARPAIPEARYVVCMKSRPFGLAPDRKGGRD